MTEAAPAFASLDAAMIRRGVAAVPPTDASEAGRWPDWREDLRFVITAYLGGLIFFLILLS